MREMTSEVSGVSWPAGDRDRAQSRASNTGFFCHPSLPYLPHPTLDFIPNGLLISTCATLSEVVVRYKTPRLWAGGLSDREGTIR